MKGRNKIVVGVGLLVTLVFGLGWVRSYAYTEEVAYAKSFAGPLLVVDVLHSEAGRLGWNRSFTREMLPHGFGTVSIDRSPDSPSYFVRGFWFERPLAGNFQLVFPYLWVMLAWWAVCGLAWWSLNQRSTVSSNETATSTLP